MKKVAKRITISIGISIILLIVSLIIFDKVNNYICQKTKIPNGLTAAQTVELYFKYWDDGNDKGRDGIWGTTEDTSESFNMDEYFCKVKLIDYKEIPKEEIDVKYPHECYDYAEISTHFSFHVSLCMDCHGFSDGDYILWNYYLVKDTKDSNWRIFNNGVC